MARHEPEPVRITSATRSHSDDIGGRQRRYVLAMAVRTVCFLLAVVAMGHWLMWVFLFGSVFLPYFAVVVANAGASPDPGGPDPFDFDPQQRALEGPSQA